MLLTIQPIIAQIEIPYSFSFLFHPDVQPLTPDVCYPDSACLYQNNLSFLRNRSMNCEGSLYSNSQNTVFSSQKPLNHIKNFFYCAIPQQNSCAGYFVHPSTKSATQCCLCLSLGFIFICWWIMSRFDEQITVTAPLDGLWL
jgi:hypothetical protein